MAKVETNSSNNQAATGASLNEQPVTTAKTEPESITTRVSPPELTNQARTSQAPTSTAIDLEKYVEESKSKSEAAEVVEEPLEKSLKPTSSTSTLAPTPASNSATFTTERNLADDSTTSTSSKKANQETTRAPILTATDAATEQVVTTITKAASTTSTSTAPTPMVVTELASTTQSTPEFSETQTHSPATNNTIKPEPEIVQANIEQQKTTTTTTTIASTTTFTATATTERTADSAKPFEQHETTTVSPSIEKKATALPTTTTTPEIPPEQETTRTASAEEVTQPPTKTTAETQIKQETTASITSTNKIDRHDEIEATATPEAQSEQQATTVSTTEASNTFPAANKIERVTEPSATDETSSELSASSTDLKQASTSPTVIESSVVNTGDQEETKLKQQQQQQHTTLTQKLKQKLKSQFRHLDSGSGSSNNLPTQASAGVPVEQQGIVNQTNESTIESTSPKQAETPPSNNFPSIDDDKSEKIDLENKIELDLTTASTTATTTSSTKQEEEAIVQNQAEINETKPSIEKEEATVAPVSLEENNIQETVTEKEQPKPRKFKIGPGSDSHTGHGHSHDHIYEQHDHTHSASPSDQNNEVNETEMDNKVPLPPIVDISLSNNEEKEEEINFNLKWCLNLSSLKRVLTSKRYLGSVYSPVLTMLPSGLQSLLLDNTSLGLNLMSLLLVGNGLFFWLFGWYFLAKRDTTKQASAARALNEQLVAAANKQRQLEFENRTFAALISDMEKKSRKKSENNRGDFEQQLAHAERAYAQLRQNYENTVSELNALRASDEACRAELYAVSQQYASCGEEFAQEKANLECELAGANEALKEYEQRCGDDEQKLGYYEALLREQQAQMDKINGELAAKETTVAMLKNSLLLRVNKASSNSQFQSSSSNDNDSDDMEVINKGKSSFKRSIFIYQYEVD